MSILNKVTSGRRGRAQKVVISGPEGFGKSTIASQFPGALFLDVEDSTSQLEVDRLRREDVPTLKAFESALDEIVSAKPCQTVVVDTIDWLELMALDDIIAAAGNSKITGIEDFGYGKGYTYLKERVNLLLAKFDQVIAAGINVVLLAHVKVTKFEPPDGAGPYDRYELKLSKQVAPLVKEWADMLLFGNWRTQVKERDKNEAGAQFKGVGGKDRQMHCTRTAAWDAKNRHGMADTEKWEIGVIQAAFERVGAPWDIKLNDTPAPQPVPPPKPVESAQAQPAQSAEGPVMVADAELERILSPHEEKVNAYLRSNNRIQARETFRNIQKDYAERIKKNPAGFLKVAGAATAPAATESNAVAGEAVAA